MLGGAAIHPTAAVPRAAPGGATPGSWPGYGGPAGCEAARAQARAGARVVRFEAGAQPGGRAPWAAHADYQRWHVRAETGNEVRLETTAAAPNVAALRPDLVVLASGAWRRVPSLPLPAVGPDEVVAAPPGWRRALVWDATGSWEAASSASTLLAGGAQVRSESRAGLLGRLQAAGVRTYARVSLAERDGSRHLEGPWLPAPVDVGQVDGVIWAGHPEARQELRNALVGAGLTVAPIGDALAPRGSSPAVREGHAVAERLLALADRERRQ